MKREIRDIIEQDVVIPDIVLQAKETAYANLPDNVESVVEDTKEIAGKRTRRKFGKKWVAIAAVAVLVVGTMSAGATSGFSWYEKIQEAMFITDSEKNTVDKYGLGSEPKIAAKDKGVTITAEQTVFDGKAFFVVLSIDGVEVPTKENEPITFWDFSITGNNGEESINYGGSYLGMDEETGKALYLWEGSLPEGTDTLIVELGEMNAESIESDPEHEGLIHNELWRVDGNWKLEIPVEYAEHEIAFNLREVTGKSDSPLGDVIITPLSIECQTIYEGGFYGFLMKDGSIKSAHFGGGGMGPSTDEDFYGWEIWQNFGTVVDIDQIEAILFDDITDNVETRNLDNPTVDDFIVVPLPVIE